MADWWEEYKKKNNLEARADEARKQEAQKQTARQAANDPYVKALQQERDRALLLNKTGDLAGLVKDTLFGTVQTVSAPFGSPMQQASANLNYQANRSAQDMARYKALEQQAYDMAPHNPTARNRELYYAAKAGQQRAAGNYASAYEKYMNASTAAEKSRRDELKRTDPGSYYGETLSKDQIEGQLRVINRQLQNIEAMRQGAAPTDYAYDVTVRSDNRMQELEQQKAMYESALRQRTAIDKQAEMQELARSVTGRSDYDRLVRAGREIVLIKNNNARPYGYQFSPDDPDDNRQFARAEQKNLEAMKAAGYVDDLDSSYIPEEVKPVYYALYAGDPAKAKEWADYWRAIGEDKYWSEIYQQSGADTGSRLKAFIEGTWANTVSGLDPFGEGGQYAAKLGSTMIGGGAAGLTEKGLFNTGFGSGTYHSNLFGDLSLGSAYQLGSSMLQSAANATLAKMTGGLAGVTGGMGTILLGSSAAAQDYQQKIEQGWDEDSAKLHALAAGAAESIFEYVSLDKLVNEDVTRGFLRNFLTQGGVEASEEAFTTIANRISDAAISELNGYDNQIQSKAKELMAKGYEKGAAEKMARQEWFTELMSDALGGFVSGGIMSSGQYAMQPIYRAIEFNDFTRALSDTGEQSIDSTKDLTKGRVGRLMGRVGAMLSTEQIEAARKITGQQGETSENQSKRQQKKQSTRDGAVYEQAVQSIQQQIEQRGVGAASEVYNETVQKYGEAAKEIAQEAIYRSAGQTMSRATDMAELERSANSMAKGAAPEVFEAVRKAKDQRAFDLYRQSGNTEDAERMMQQKAGNQSHGGALNMEAVITRNGAEQKASITGLSKDGKGVVLSDGSTVTAKEFASKDFSADADTKDIVGFLLKSDMGPAAELALQNYITQAKAGRATDGYRYVMDTALAFNQGRRGAISVEQARQRSSLDAETVSRFFALGEETRKSDTAKEQAHVDELLANAAKGVTGRKGSVDTSKVNRKLSDAEAKNLEVATKLAEVLGVDLGIFVSESDAKGRFVGENGRYEDGKIWIDINAGRNSVEDIGSGILACMSHELTHFIQDYAPNAYAELKQFVLRQLTEAKGSAWVDRQIQSKIRRSKGQQLSITAAEDEVVADACQNVLTDSKAIHDYAKRFPQSFSEILEWIKDFFAKVKEALSSRPMSDEAKVMAQLEDKVRKAFGELWDKGVMEAAEVHSKVGSKQSGTQQQNSERDTEYLELAKDPEKNREWLQEMVEEAADQAGYTIKAYHGTREDFTVFDKSKFGDNFNGYSQLGGGFYFAMDEDEAKRWANRAFGKGNPKVMPVYLRGQNMLSADEKIRSAVAEKALLDAGIDKSDIGWYLTKPDRFVEALRFKNYSPQQIQDLFAEMGYDGVYEADGKRTQFVVFNPEQVKSADPVTYDDDGNVIPLSQRFNRENEDIRYQERTRLEGQMGLFGEDGSIQTGMFGAEAQEGEQTGLFEEKPKSGGKLFLDSLQAFLEKKKANQDVLYGKEFDAFYEEHPELNFVKRFMDNDPKTRADLQAFAASIDDEKVLSDLSWYTTQSPSISKKPGYRGALTKVRNVYKNRISEIAAEKNNGRVYKLERKAYDAKEIRRIFDELNTNEAMSKLADKVFDTTRSLGLQFYATNRILGKQQALVGGTNAGKNIWLRINTFADKGLSDQYKASVILHEMIHACTNYAFSSDYKRSPYQNERIINAVNAMEAVYQQAKYEKSLQGEYGLKEIREFTAELANPEFREKLEKVSLLERAINAIKRFFGIEKTNALDSASTALDYLLDNLDTEGFREYSGKVERDIEYLERQNGMARYSERDYDIPSDLELMDEAAENLSEAGGEEYWKALLESAPELADQREELKSLMRANREQAKKLQEAEKQLADAERQMTLTNRAVNTKGINEMVLGVMKDLAAGDAKGKHVAKRVREILINAYQKALDMIDKGADAGTAWTTVYNDGVVPAAELLGSEATHSEKIGYKWSVGTLASYAGQDTILEYLSAAVGADFAANRYRGAIQATEADSIAERAKRPVQKKLDEAKEKNRALTTQNERLSSDLDELKRHWQSSADQVTTLNELLQDTRQELKEGKRLSEKERKAKLKRIESLSAQLKAKRAEAKAWKELAERNESVLRAALSSKNADIDELRMQMNKNATEAQKKQAALVKKLKDQVEREKKILEGTLKPPAMQKLLQAVREEARKNAEQHKDEVFERYKERKNQTAIRNRIKNLHAEMQRDLLRPREGHFVPEALVRPVVELLDMVNTQTKRAKSENAQAKIDAINAQYDKLKADERYSQYYDETVKAMLVELSSTLEGRSIYELSADELSDVYTAMKAMRTTIRNAILADLVEKGKQIWEIGNELRQELRNGKGASPYLLEKYHMAMLSAERAFNRFGGYREGSTWNKVYKMLDDAQLKMLNLEMQATRIFDPVLKAKEDFEKAQNLTSLEKGALVDVGLRDENGKSVWITRGMMLSLYMHLQNEQNMKHLMYGGLTLPDFKRYYKGSDEAWGRGTVEIPALGARVANLDALLEEYGEAWVRSQYKSMEEDIKKMFESVRESIEKQMTDYDRKWIAASKDFFDNFSRRELNRVTNEMYGFSKARVDNYFPIVTDSNFLKSEFDSISRNISLENAGFMKERVKASNPILLEDITKTVNRQISNVSRYAGLTQALKQFGNIYNVQTKGFTDSVKKAMAKSYGKNGQEYIQNLITDMVGGRSTPGSTFDRIKGNYAQAILSSNLSVTIKQAASFPTAAATVGWKPIMKALAKGGRNGRLISRADRALIDTYSPLLWKRAQGAIDTEIGDMAHAQDWTKKAKWLMGWIEKTDIATVGRLWYAAEYYVQDNFADLEKGSEEQIKAGDSPFYRKVAEVFNRIVEDTQPNYTVLQRPDILRNPNKLVRAMTMFSTQRFQNANILIDAVNEYAAMVRYDKNGKTAETKAARKEAKTKLTRAISSQVVSAVVLNAMTLLAGALMHRMNSWRDDDDELTVSSIAEEYLNGFLSTMAGAFLGGSELYEAISSMLSGSRYYGNDVGGISSINDFATAVVQFGQQAVKLIGDEESKTEDWKKLAEKQLASVGQYLAQMTGIPVGNVNKIISGGKNHVIDIVNGEFLSFEAGLDRANATNGRRYFKAWTAGDTAKMTDVYQELLENVKGDEDKARNAINKAFKTAYDAGDLSLEEYTRFITESGLFDEDKQKNKVRDLAQDAYDKGKLDDDAVRDYLTGSGFFDENKAWEYTQRWEAKSEHEDDEDYSWNQYEEIYAAVDAGEALGEAEKDLLDHGYTQEQITAAAVKRLRERFQNGNASEEETIRGLVRYKGMNENDAWLKAQEWDARADHAEDEDYTWSKYTAIYEAIDENNDLGAAINELTAHGVSADAIRKQAKSYLIEKYENGDLNETQLRNMLSRYCRITAKKDVDEIVNNANCFRDSGFRYSELKTAYNAGDLTEAKAKQMLTRYGGMSASEAASKVRYWSFQTQHPDAEISQEKLDAYYEKRPAGYNGTMKDAGIPLNTYVSYCEKAAKATGTDADGDGKTDSGTKKAAIMQIINGMNLTNAQKDALYYFNGWAAKTISDAPWH